MLSNTSPKAVNAIQQQFNRMTCPMPSISGLWNDTSSNPSGTITYSRATYNYAGLNNNTLTLTCTKVHTANGQDYYYGCPTCVGMFVFLGDFISELGDKVGAFFTLVAYILAPINLTVLGQTINNMNTIALGFVVTVYAFCYLSIGVFIYKAVSPFGGIA